MHRTLDRSTLPYTALFCEENIWQLARLLTQSGVSVAAQWVLLITNPGQQVLMLAQRAAGDVGYVVWDYHVVLLVRLPEGDLIFDPDTELPFPVEAATYLNASFPEDAVLPEMLRARVRRIPAAEFLRRFWSDRSHMVGTLAPGHFPPWPPITPECADAITLATYRDSEAALDDGSVVSTPGELLRWLTSA